MNTLTHTSLFMKLTNLKYTLRERFGINSIAVFGSFARSEENDNSDIDIVVLNMDKKNAFILIKAQHFLEENLGKKVDLGLYDAIRPFIKKRIEKELLYV